MIIDFHTHIFPDRIAAHAISSLEQSGGITAKTDGTLPGLFSSMDQAGVDMSVILPVATKPAQFMNIQSFAESINEQYSDKVMSFGGIHPDSANYRKQMNIIADLGFKGVKIHPDYQGVMIDDIRYLRIIEYASELGLIIITHAGVDIGFPDLVRCTPERALRVLQEVKPDKLVLAHCGGWGLWEEVIDTLAGESVYMDTAYSMGHISEELFVTLCRSHGVEKMLFGSDCPWGNPKRDLEAFLTMPLTAQEQELILHQNAERLLGNM